jgi:putative endonuclease
MINTKRTGNLGEKIAENYLKNKGYQILDKNYSFRMQGNPLKGEIDIVAKKDDIITFIEVKTLWQTQGKLFLPARLNFARQNFGGPEEKVNFGKQKKLVKMAESWLMEKKIPLNSKWQIDVIAITVDPKRKIKINHFENAISYV